MKTPKVPKDTSDNGDKRRRLIVFLTLSAAAMLLLAVGIWKGPSLLGVFKPNSDSTQRGATDSLAKPSIQSETPKEAVATDDHAHGDVTGHHDEASDSTGKHSDVAVDEKPSEQKTSEVKEATQKTELIANGDGISKKKPLPESKTSSAQKAPTQKAPKKLTAIDGKVLKGTLASAKPKKTPSSALASAAQLKKQRLAERSRFDNALPLEKVSKQKITPAMLRDAPEDKNNPQYVVQLYSSPDRSDVEDYQKNLRKRKIDTDISDFQQKDRKWYRLRSQTFSSLNEAKNFARSLREPYWIDRVR